MNDRHLATIITRLQQTATVAAITEATGLTRKVIYKALKTLREQNVARICGWNRDITGRSVEPVWALGSEPSAERPKFTAAEKMARFRKKRRQKRTAGVRVMQQFVASAGPAADIEAELGEEV